MKVVFDTETLLLTIDGKVLRLVDNKAGGYFLHGLLNTQELDTLGGASTTFLVDPLSDLVKADQIAQNRNRASFSGEVKGTWEEQDTETMEHINEVLVL